MLSLAVFFAALAVASAQTCSSVTCAQMLAFSSQPIDGAYPYFKWQCGNYSAGQLTNYLSASSGSNEQCLTGLTCGCATGACNSNNQCPSLGCTTDNGGCSSICSYNTAGAVVCSCEAGQNLVNAYQCNCEQFLAYPQSGWITATNYLCANSSSTTTGNNVQPSASTGQPAIVATTGSNSGSVSGSASGSTTAAAQPPASTTASQQVAATTAGISGSTVVAVRLQGTVAGFNLQQQIQYIQGIAGFLGISVVRVSIVSIQSGSVIANTVIAPPQSGSNEKSSSAAVTQLLNANTVDLGQAIGIPVLSVSVANPAAITTAAASGSNTAGQGEVQQPQNNGGSKGLSGGAIAGIVIGSVAAIVIITAIIVFAVVHRSNKKRDMERVRTDLPTSASMQSSNSMASLHSSSSAANLTRHNNI